MNVLAHAGSKEACLLISKDAADVFVEFICHASAAVVAFLQAGKFLQGEAQLQGFLWNGAWYDKGSSYQVINGRACRQLFARYLLLFVRLYIDFQ